MAAMTGLRATHEFATVSMDTVVNVQIVSDQPRDVVEPAVQRALAWFETVERICTRFDPTSEVMQLLGKVGHPVRVSTLRSAGATITSQICTAASSRPQ